MKSATYTRRIKNSREIVGVSTVTFGSKNEPTPTQRSIVVACVVGDPVRHQGMRMQSVRPLLWHIVGQTAVDHFGRCANDRQTGTCELDQRERPGRLEPHVRFSREEAWIQLPKAGLAQKGFRKRAGYLFGGVQHAIRRIGRIESTCQLTVEISRLKGRRVEPVQWCAGRQAQESRAAGREIRRRRRRRHPP